MGALFKLGTGSLDYQSSQPPQSELQYSAILQSGYNVIVRSTTHQEDHSSHEHLFSVREQLSHYQHIVIENTP